MPYFIFSITPGPSQLVSHAEFLQECETFKEAKKLTREKRSEQSAEAAANIRMVFAKDRIEAEELLGTRREKPILQEWEK